MAEPFLSLREIEIGRNAAQRRILRGGVAAAIALHAAVLAVLIWHPHRTLPRVTVAHQGTIAAFVNVTPAPAGTTGAAPKPVVQKPKRVTLAASPNAAEPKPVANEASGPAQDATPGAQGGGPVRMSVGQIQLLRKVDPVYPPVMLAAKREGTVVVDATINPDGSIGDVKVLQSLGPCSIAPRSRP